MKLEDYLASIDAEYELYIKYARFIHPSFISLGCNDGWILIIRRIFEYCEEHNYPIKIRQIKEKFGELRVYYSNTGVHNDEHDANIGRLIAQSADTCDVCGGVGDSLGSKGWIVTRCPAHKTVKFNHLDGHWAEIYDHVGRLEARVRTAAAVEGFNDFANQLEHKKQVIRDLVDLCKEHDINVDGYTNEMY